MNSSPKSVPNRYLIRIGILEKTIQAQREELRRLTLISHQYQALSRSNQDNPSLGSFLCDKCGLVSSSQLGEYGQCDSCYDCFCQACYQKLETYQDSTREIPKLKLCGYCMKEANQ